MLVLEAAPTIGGGTRTEELTLPGFRHDVCSAIHPLAVGSPFLRGLPLARARARARASGGCRSPTRSTTAARSCCTGRSRRPRTASAAMRRPTAGSWGRSPTRGRSWSAICSARRCGRPRHPVPAARFGLLRRPLGDRAGAARASRGERARALLAGNAAHAMRPLDGPAHRGVRAHAARCSATASAGRQPSGGSQAIADAMASLLRSLGGEIETGTRGALARRASRRAQRALRPHAATDPRDRRRRAARPLPAGARALPLRARRVQARLRARRAGALDGARLPRRRHGARRRHARGDRRSRARGRARRASAAAVRAGRAAEPLRPEPRACRRAHAVGLLPRAQRLERRHDRAPSSSRSSGSRPASATSCGARSAMGPADRAGAQRELHRRRHQRRRWPTCARSCCGPSARPNPYTTPEPAPVHLLVVDASRRRRARDVRLARGARCARGRPPVERAANPEGARRAACTTRVGDVAVGPRRSSGGRHRLVQRHRPLRRGHACRAAAAGSRESTFGSTRRRATPRSPGT